MSIVDKTVIVPYDRVEEISATFAGKRILVGGCFDGLHIGHVTFLEKAKSEGDFLIVAIEPDEFIVKRKGKKPLHTQKLRAKMLGALRVVDAVVMLPLFTGDQDYLTLTQEIQPSAIAITEGDPNREKKAAHAQAAGGRLAVVTPHIEGFASSRINL